MITILSGTNRHDSTTFQIAKMAEQYLQKLPTTVQILDLKILPENLFQPHHYKEGIPLSFRPFETMLAQAHGILVVVPEYNGSYPGVLKYFLDLLPPKTLYEKPTGFIGLGSGDLGGRTPVEQLQTVFLYRHAHLFGPNLLIRKVNKTLDDTKTHFLDESLEERFQQLLQSFVGFVEKLK